MPGEELDEAARASVAALVAEMAVHGRGRDEPVRSTMAYVGDRWSSLILLVLQTGEWRHAVLRRVLSEISHEGAISQRVLTLKLRSLERDGFVLRSVSADVPPRVAYRLSASGHGLVAQVRTMIDWVAGEKQAIGTARARFDALD
jgi:DNA-binding HxlR family transcriptional regulator